ncbi:hypothetical protein ILUMI_07471 [Ignelater luminosus]|uniref:Acyl-coenzyme A oxidase n=1 Tax=Ignelater luminosus TaxID=2038154 RepID=A0A8K0GGU5_IGNLU|nr:hypothetical protein ILUMI_07471 [Ignelater luminosus]
MANCLSDFPPGPLDKYRKLASFDWKQLSLFLNGEEFLNYRNELYNEILKYSVLLEQTDQTPTLDELRRKTTQKVFALKLVRDSVTARTNCNYADMSFAESSLAYLLDPSASVKRSVTFYMFTSVIASMGTERHRHFIENCLNGEILGCFGLTEIGHGSNTRGMRTTATYDPASRQFILHSPDFQAAKCWVGSLGQTATHGAIFAQLVTPDGIKHGLHAFVVPIRDSKTLVPYPGVKVGDMGEKIGLNGVDNGFIMFDQYHIPRENLLNKIGDVTEDGRYVADITDPNRRHGAALGNLSDGRINITSVNMCYLSKAVTIAIRYAAVRKQFSATEDDEEIPILEYQSHQHRLLPHLATFYAFRTFCKYLLEERDKFQLLLNKKSIDVHRITNTGLELHAISSACKSLAGWYARDAIQECREACAGHGYLKASGLGELRSNQDVCCTYEGENHVLIQQTSNWLLRLWPLVLKGKSVSTPLNTVEFLNRAPQILTSKFTPNSFEELTEPKNILDTFQWLVCYLLKLSFEKYESLKQHSLHSVESKAFWAKNDSQVFYAKSLSIAYIQHLILTAMSDKISKAADFKIKTVLEKLFALFAVTCLEKHIPFLYAGSYASGPTAAVLIQDSILRLCKSIKNDAIALVDVIAPPDFIVNSVLGYSDGQVYKHLEAAMLRAPGALSRPSWWKEITNWKKNIHSKL